jgi:hypothetical protein
VYWMPIWNFLDEHGFQLLLVNPAQVKALQGRKSDHRDAQRIAEFLQDERLDGSFVPPREIRELRRMLRHRQSLLEQRNEVHNQIRDLLETAKPRQRNLWVTDTVEQCRESSARGPGEPAAGCWASACFRSQLPFRTSLTSSVNGTPSGRSYPHLIIRVSRSLDRKRPTSCLPVTQDFGRQQIAPWAFLCAADTATCPAIRQPASGAPKLNEDEGPTATCSLPDGHSRRVALRSAEADLNRVVAGWQARHLKIDLHESNKSRSHTREKNLRLLPRNCHRSS